MKQVLMHVYAMCSVCYTSMMLAMKALDINFWPFLFIIKKNNSDALYALEPL